MRKPTIEDLSRIKNELREMSAYISINLPVSRYLTSADLIYGSLSRAVDELENAICELPNIREGVIDDH